MSAWTNELMGVRGRCRATGCTFFTAHAAYDSDADSVGAATMTVMREAFQHYLDHPTHSVIISPINESDAN